MQKAHAAKTDLRKERERNVFGSVCRDSPVIFLDSLKGENMMTVRLLDWQNEGQLPGGEGIYP